MHGNSTLIVLFLPYFEYMFLQIMLQKIRYKPIMVCTFALIVNPKVTVDQYLHLPKNLVPTTYCIDTKNSLLVINQSET